MDFNNFDIITPNEREARFLGDQTQLSVHLQKTYMIKLIVKNLLKLGPKGVIVFYRETKK